MWLGCDAAKYREVGSKSNVWLQSPLWIPHIEPSTQFPLEILNWSVSPKSTPPSPNARPWTWSRRRLKSCWPSAPMSRTTVAVTLWLKLLSSFSLLFYHHRNSKHPNAQALPPWPDQSFRGVIEHPFAGSRAYLRTLVCFWEFVKD